MNKYEHVDKTNKNDGLIERIEKNNEIVGVNQEWIAELTNTIADIYSDVASIEEVHVAKHETVRLATRVESLGNLARELASQIEEAHYQIAQDLKELEKGLASNVGRG